MWISVPDSEKPLLWRQTEKAQGLPWLHHRTHFWRRETHFVISKHLQGVLLPRKARWLTNHPSDLTYFVFIVFLAINCHVVKDVSITYYILTLKLKCVEHFLLRIFIKSNNDRDQLAVCSFSFNIAKITGF